MAFAVTWAGVWIGLMVRDPDGADGIAMAVIFPTMFLSGIFVPVAGLPDGLRQIAEFNPLTSLATAMRQLFGSARPARSRTSGTLQHPVLTSLRLGGGADGDLRAAVGPPLQADGSLSAWLDNTLLVDQHHRLHAVAQIQLDQHAADVRLDRRLGHDELARRSRALERPRAT